jgi:hypothetical protein
MNDDAMILLSFLRLADDARLQPSGGLLRRALPLLPRAGK